MQRKLIHAALLCAAIIPGLSLPLQAEVPPYRDKSLPVEQRVDDLIGRLTLEQKAALLMASSPAIDSLGIKEYNWWSEALHGVGRNGNATTFPQAIGLAATFDEPLLEEVFTVVSDEGRQKFFEASKTGRVKRYQGITFWTPNINIFRDPRWGRGMETYGEDPFLSATLGMACVRGLQGAPGQYPIKKAHACAKHFAVHSGPEGTRHSFDVDVTERDLFETYLPAFKALVTKGGVNEVMMAYNRFRGIPCAANSYLIDTLLRGEWGYRGMVVSDCGAIVDFYGKGRHEWVPDEVFAAAKAVHAGTDVECGNVYSFIPEAVSRGILSVEDVDRNLRRVLTERYLLGEMDGVHLPEKPADFIEGKANRELALKAAQESMVLLQNRGGILPLSGKERIAVVGPNADDAEMMWGNYNPIPLYSTTLLQGLRGRLGDIPYERGCGIMDARYAPDDSPLDGLTPEQKEKKAADLGISIDILEKYVRRARVMKESFLPDVDIDALLKKLEGIDIVIFAGGISPRFEGEEMPVKVPGFTGGDRTTIEMPSVQSEVMEALHRAGKKVILVNFSGCAIGLEREKASCEAILQAWYPGEEGGKAIADILLGKVSPSGKTPVTFYRSTEDLPDFDDYSMKGRTYRFFEGEALFPFGFGLSYGNFSISSPKVEGGSVTVEVTNKGSMDASEVVQMYIRRPSDSEGPRLTLRAYKRVSVPKGRTVKVSLPLSDETFSYWNGKRMAPLEGDYEILVGNSSRESDLRKVSYTYKGEDVK